MNNFKAVRPISTKFGMKNLAATCPKSKFYKTKIERHEQIQFEQVRHFNIANGQLMGRVRKCLCNGCNGVRFAATPAVEGGCRLH